MPFKKGQSGNPKGRKPGQPNKVTTEFKEAVAEALRGIDVATLLEAVPSERRLEVAAKIAEYAFPKLARSEVTGKDGGPLEVIEIVRETADGH